MVTRALGSRPVTAAIEAVTGDRLRILAYHAVNDPEPFARQIDELAARWHPVDGAAVARALAGGEPLPRRAVWVTFDDGSPTVIDHASAVLDRFDVPATIFVCPGLIEHDSPPWWQVVEGAFADPAEGSTRVTELKSVPDAERRRIVADLEADMATRGNEVVGHQLTLDQLRQWTASGREVGNHSWDHPCLDRCDAADQREQIDRTHAWLGEHLAPTTALFAYPNGNFSDTVDDELAVLGYPVGLLFDHRLARVRPADARRLSRLRIDASADIDRFRAVISGAHSITFHAGRAAQGRVRR